jgi:hypothetical protein
MEVIERYIHGKFMEWNVRFIGVVDRADSHDISNKKARQIGGLVNEWYLEEISENIRKTLQSKKRRGEFTGSFAPYGYLKDPNNKSRLIVDEQVAPIIRDIFDWYLQGWGYRKIVITLNERGISNPLSYKQQHDSNYKNFNAEKSVSKGLWTTSTIFKMIRNETYNGTLVQGKSKNISYKNRKKRPVPESEWIKVPNCHEPIISDDIWVRVVEKLGENIRACKTTQEVWSLSGKVKCAVCGSPMKRTVYYNKNRTIQYFNLICGTIRNGSMDCRNKSLLHGSKFNALMIGRINELISNYCERDSIVIQSEHDCKLARLTADCESIRMEIAKSDSIIGDFYEDKHNGIISKERCVSLVQRHEIEISKLTERLKRIEQQTESVRESTVDEEHRRRLIDKYTSIDELTKQIVDEFIDMVYIGEKVEGQDREITVHWKF